VAQSPEQFDIHRLRKLIADKCNDAISPADHEELDALLVSSSTARAEYWDTMALHSELEWELAGKEACDDLLTRVVLEDANADSASFVHRVIAGVPMVRVFAVAASLLAIVLGGGVLLWMASDRQAPVHADRKSDQKTAEESFVLGRISPLVPDSRWSYGGPGKINPAAVSQGDTISVDRGAVELQFASNTVAVLESPLVMQVMSVDRVRVILGNIKVEVAKGAEGFVVETASAEVIDLGTVFAVNVEDGNTDLVVYDGHVDLKVTGAGDSNNAERVTKRFRAGEAVHVNDDGTLSRIVNVTHTNFSRTELREPLITEVKDSVVRPETWDFYEIVPGGMAEDQRAYVDRPHEWNGAAPVGMPAYLVGGDYVKTFCNDKITKDLHVQVTLGRPAVLFVLFDKRAVPPEWLTESFEETGDEIGVDETGFDVWKQEPTARNLLAVGPGNSIERRFSIWRKVVTKADTVPLGPNGAPIKATEALDLNAKMAMYGIVAVPLDAAAR
jgi:hypothetical protein